MVYLIKADSCSMLTWDIIKGQLFKWNWFMAEFRVTWGLSNHDKAKPLKRRWTAVHVDRIYTAFRRGVTSVAIGLPMVL